jgi:hypothetical protein
VRDVRDHDRAGVLAAVAITTSLVQFRRDGYRRTPTLRF